MPEQDKPRGRRARTRAALLEAAAKVFVARGYEAASLDEIAASAGFTRGAIYSSFDDKEDLFLNVVAGFNEKWISSFERAFSQVRDIGSASTSLEALWAEFAGSDEQQTRLMMEFRVVALRNKSVARRLAEFEKRTENAMMGIAQAQADAGLTNPSLPAKDLALLLYAASQGILLHEMACRTSHPELFSNLVRLAFPSSQRGSASPKSNTARRTTRKAVQ